MDRPDFAELVSQRLRTHLDAVREGAPGPQRRKSEIAAIRRAISGRARSRRRRCRVLRALIGAAVIATVLPLASKVTDLRPQVAVAPARSESGSSGLVIHVHQGARVDVPDEPGVLLLWNGALDINMPHAEAAVGVRVRTPNTEVEGRGATAFTVRVVFGRTGCANPSTLVDLRAGTLTVSRSTEPGEVGILAAPLRWDSCGQSSDPGTPWP